MGSYPGQSPFTPPAVHFGQPGSGAERPPQGGNLFGSGSFTRAGDMPGSDPWTSFLLPSAMPRANSAATPASRFGSAGDYGFRQPSREPQPSPFGFGAGAAPRPGADGGMLHSGPAHAEAQDAPPLVSMLDDRGAATLGPDARPEADAHQNEGGAQQPPTGPLGLRGSAGADGPEAATPAPEDAFWVTVFGFMPDVLALVLRELQPSSGAMLAHRQGGGNWVYVRFGSQLEQEEALAKNGRVVSGSMIGVLRGIHPRGASPPSDLIGGSTAVKQTAWLAPTRPALSTRLEARPSVSQHAGVPARTAAQPYSGLGGLWLRVTEYVFGW